MTIWQHIMSRYWAESYILKFIVICTLYSESAMLRIKMIDFYIKYAELLLVYYFHHTDICKIKLFL